MVNYTTYAVVKGLNLQAWRIPLWENFAYVTKNSDKVSQPPSLENPFVGGSPGHYQKYYIYVSTSKPGESLCGGLSQPSDFVHPEGLNLQAWRIPLWV